MLPGDAEVRPDQAHSRNAAQADDKLRANQRYLRPEIVNAGVLLRFQRIPVFWGPAFYNIRYIAIGSIQIDDTEHIIQQLPGRADKRLALQILLLAGAFAHEQDIRIPRADAKDHIVAGLA